MKKLLHDILIENRTVAFHQEAASWQDAVKICTDLLEKSGCVTSEYYQAILRTCKKLGPYFILAPGIAMPHADPKSGVLKEGFALVTLKEPVHFGDPDNDPVDILLALSSPDRKSHNEKAIVQAVNLLDNDERLKQLRSMNSLEEFTALMKTIDKDETS